MEISEDYQRGYEDGLRDAQDSPFMNVEPIIRLPFVPPLDTYRLDSIDKIVRNVEIDEDLKRIYEKSFNE